MTTTRKQISFYADQDVSDFLDTIAPGVKSKIINDALRKALSEDRTVAGNILFKLGEKVDPVSPAGGMTSLTSKIQERLAALQKRLDEQMEQPVACIMCGQPAEPCVHAGQDAFRCTDTQCNFVFSKVVNTLVNPPKTCPICTARIQSGSYWAQDPQRKAHVTFGCGSGITRNANGRWCISEITSECRVREAITPDEAQLRMGEEL
jgi:hypothetical protein